MLYILESTHNIHAGHTLHPAQVEAYLNLLRARIDSNHLVGAYTKVGGGAIAIVNYPDAQALFNRLRQLNIHNVTVTPVFETTEVLAAYHAHHKASGAYDDAHKHDGEGDHPVATAKKRAGEMAAKAQAAHAKSKGC